MQKYHPISIKLYYILVIFIILACITLSKFPSRKKRITMTEVEWVSTGKFKLMQINSFWQKKYLKLSWNSFTGQNTDNPNVIFVMLYLNKLEATFTSFTQCCNFFQLSRLEIFNLDSRKCFVNRILNIINIWILFIFAFFQLLAVTIYILTGTLEEV